MNNYISLFNCLILEKKLNIDNTEIKNFILKNKKNGRKLSNFGGYQSNDLNLKDSLEIYFTITKFENDVGFSLIH